MQVVKKLPAILIRVGKRKGYCDHERETAANLGVCSIRYPLLLTDTYRLGHEIFDKAKLFNSISNRLFT